jgi:hypothetical protein
MLYLGLSGFYSAYLGLRSSFSSTQLQATPRSASLLPYTGCSPVESLSDIHSVQNPYVPIDAFATDPDWKTKFDLTDVSKRVLRPCGALFYWIPTDTFVISPAISERVDDLSWDELNIPAEPSGQAFPYIDNTTGEFVWADPSTQKFRAWMRSNIGTDFLVKYAEFPSGISPGDYTVNVTNCRALDADKFIRICTTGWMGISQVFLSAMYFICASTLLVGVVVFILLGKFRRFT